MSYCVNSKCTPDIGCKLGERTLAACKNWQSEAAEAKGSRAPEADASLLPWTGNALGTSDLAFIAGRCEPSVIGVMGAHNAGKTTMLAAFYQEVARKGRADGKLFAGSFTLEGWEAIAHALRWDGYGPSFPAHTTSGLSRAPGMLHLALRDCSGRLSDHYMADAPGEWFRRWAVERNAPDAEGARWLVERATRLLVVADCEALSGTDRGNARNDLSNLLRRVGSERWGQPTALVWTKADVDVSQEIRSSITTAAFRAVPDIAEFAVSVKDFTRDGIATSAADSLSALFAWTIRSEPRGIKMMAAVETDQDPFYHVGSPS